MATGLKNSPATDDADDGVEEGERSAAERHAEGKGIDSNATANEHLSLLYPTLLGKLIQILIPTRRRRRLADDKP